jgi:hypothetical protein
MPSKDTKSRPALISCAGILFSLALHILLMAPVLMGLGANMKRPNIHSNEVEASTYDDTLSSSMTVTFIDVADVSVPSQANYAKDRLAAAGPPLKTVSDFVPEPEFDLPAEGADSGHCTYRAGVDASPHTHPRRGILCVPRQHHARSTRRRSGN